MVLLDRSYIHLHFPFPLNFLRTKTNNDFEQQSPLHVFFTISDVGVKKMRETCTNRVREGAVCVQGCLEKIHQKVSDKKSAKLLMMYFTGRTGVSINICNM